MYREHGLSQALLFSAYSHMLHFILFSALLLSPFDYTRHLKHAAQAEPSLNFNFISAAGVQKVTMTEITFAIRDHHQDGVDSISRVQ